MSRYRANASTIVEDLLDPLLNYQKELEELVDDLDDSLVEFFEQVEESSIPEDVSEKDFVDIIAMKIDNFVENASGNMKRSLGQEIGDHYGSDLVKKISDYFEKEK